MAKIYNIFVSVLLLLLMAACSQPPIPRSGGRPFDVAIVTGEEMAGRVVMRELSGCTDYYSNDEPMFNLSLSKQNGEEDVIRLARTLIIVDTAFIDNTIAIRERNVWARPQLVLYVRTPSAEQLTEDFNQLRDLFVREINDFERNILLTDMENQRNLLLEDSVIKYTGTGLYVPASMKIAHAEKDFVWLTANNSDENHSLCVYRTHRRNVNTKNMKSVTALRDSIMSRNIRGYKKDVRWHITLASERAEIRHDTILVRNRWEMSGDAMGGPSACRIIEHNDSVTFIEAFLYAPATKKRNKMARMEALLFGKY